MNGSDAEDGTGRGGTEASAAAEGDRAPHADPSEVGDPVIAPAVEAAAAASSAEVTLNGVERAERPDRVSSILVAVGPGPHSGAVVDAAREIAEATGAWLELFHVVPSDEALADAPHGGDGDDGAAEPSAAPIRSSDDDPAESGERLLDAAEERLGDFDRVDRWLVEDRSAAGAVVEQSPYYDLVVAGAPTTGAVGRFVFGSTTDTVVDGSEVPVVVVEAAESTALRDR
jgi:nucleotide-binding universal stress UspA family protein